MTDDQAATALNEYLDGPEFAQFVEQATIARDDLNDATESLNHALGQAETALVRRFRGHAAAIEIDDRTALLFWHLRGVWGLYTIDGYGEIKPLGRASRQRRVEAAALLIDLAIQLQEEP